MKKLLLSALSCFALFTFASCSEDSDVTTASDNSAEYSDSDIAYRNSPSAWEGVIGIERDGEYYITADESALKADLEAVLLEQGIETELSELRIVAQRIINDPSVTAYVLLGRDLSNRSIGVSLERNSYQFELLEPLTTVATSCTGCSNGCNLSYLLIDGKKVPYCNENGCDYDCTKSETGLF